ncbi:lipase family alpha/beta hydrolase [Actinomadura namibiensis]|uniref:GPI inositol-deacylase PGAP1-like alpha/beta domain-containing protein n=1 Tax=Actinomadura namibiensis TaxID=182080 RepID=A0A7W3QL54_ACTNM|nr:lipase [Actinomadura namibiensis]MBA8951102.1 hypothetical protein [Actinomadura namibiensis]
MRDRLAGLSPRRRVFVLTVGALALLLVGAVAGRVLIARSSGADAVAQDRPGPVLLVPGYGAGTGGLRVLAARLRSAGREAVVVEMPGDGTGDLREQARVLDRRVSEALRGGAPSVDVVAHSAGGVVARLWVREHDGAGKARRIVTLGSPHQGADLAAAGSALAPGACPEACRQLVPGSGLLRELGDRAPDPPRWVSVWTDDDETVRPEASRLPGATGVGVQEVCPDARVGHTGLPADPLVTAIVTRALDAGPPSPPGRGDCGAPRG